MLIRLLAVALPLLAVWLYNRLRWLRRQQFAHLPQAKPDLILGHAKLVHEYSQQGNAGEHFDYVLQRMLPTLGNPPVLMLDLRPFGPPVLAVCNHEVAEQLAKTSKTFPYSVPKAYTMNDLHWMIGETSLFDQEGARWKDLRRRFNPGFAPQHLMTLLPCILEKTWYCLKRLDQFAETGEEFPLTEPLIALTFDIIGTVTMDADFDAQLDTNQQGELFKLFHEMALTYSKTDATPILSYDPRIYLQRRRVYKRIDALLGTMIRTQFAESGGKTEASGSSSGDGADQQRAKKSRSVLSLSLKGIDALTDGMVQETADQLKSFLFAGHDTTAILLSWAFYELSLRPHAQEAMRSELDDVFGPDPSPGTVRDQLLQPGGEDALRRLSYTSAVIKETLRLHPPASTARLAPPGSGFRVRLPGDQWQGQELCIDGLVIYSSSRIIMRDEAVYGASKDDFVPERWLGNADTSELGTNVDANSAAAAGISADGKGNGSDGGSGGIPASAWRPFERGPRNCIGQELANLEARIILAVAFRRYDFIKVGLGEIQKGGGGQPVLNKKGQFEVNSQLYTTRQITSRPADGMRMRVQLAANASKEL